MKRAAAAIAITFLLAPMASADGVYGDTGVVSNFVWRGLSQTNNNPALQGDVGYEGPNGLYANARASTMDYGHARLRADLRGGISSILPSGVHWNLGLVTHRYDASGLDFTEAYLRLGIAGISGRVSRDWQDRNTYVSVRDRFDLGSDFGLTLHGGHTSGDTAPHYSDVAAGLTKVIQSWTLGVWASDTDLRPTTPAARAHFWLSISTRW